MHELLFHDLDFLHQVVVVHLHLLGVPQVVVGVIDAWESAVAQPVVGVRVASFYRLDLCGLFVVSDVLGAPDWQIHVLVPRIVFVLLEAHACVAAGSHRSPLGFVLGCYLGGVVDIRLSAVYTGRLNIHFAIF